MQLTAENLYFSLLSSEFFARFIILNFYCSLYNSSVFLDLILWILFGFMWLPLKNSIFVYSLGIHMLDIGIGIDGGIGL